MERTRALLRYLLAGEMLSSLVVELAGESLLPASSAAPRVPPTSAYTHLPSHESLAADITLPTMSPASLLLRCLLGQALMACPSPP